MPVQRIWVGEGPRYWMPIDYLLDPRLAAWVLPALTVCLVWHTRNSVVLWSGVGMASVALLSWIVLRRPLLTFVPGGLYWPDFHVYYCERMLLLRSGPPLPELTLPSFVPPSIRGCGDLFSLVIILIVLATRVLIVVPRRIIGVVALLVNVHPMVEWTLSMMTERSLGFGSTQARSGSTLGVMPRPSLSELFAGLLMSITICYSINVIMKIQREIPGQKGKAKGDRKQRT
jgi:hypothetical protein